MHLRIRRLVVVGLLVGSLLGVGSAPVSAQTCPLVRFITTGSCW